MSPYAVTRPLRVNVTAYPSKRVLWTLVVVPEAQTCHVDGLVEGDLQSVRLPLCVGNQPHVLVLCCDVHTIY